MLEFDFSRFDYNLVTARSILRASTIIAEYELHSEETAIDSKAAISSLAREIDLTKLLKSFKFCS